MTPKEEKVEALNKIKERITILGKRIARIGKIKVTTLDKALRGMSLVFVITEQIRGKIMEGYIIESQPIQKFPLGGTLHKANESEGMVLKRQEIFKATEMINSINHGK